MSDSGAELSGKKESGKPLDRRANATLQNLIRDFRVLLIARASKISKSEAISEDDLALAYKSLEYPDRSAIEFSDSQAVISQALAENRLFEWVAYAMGIILFVLGIVLLCLGVSSAEVSTRLGALICGSVVEVLVLIPFRLIVNSRRHNIALRMLGIVLDRIDDPKKVAPLLKETFTAIVLGRAKFTVGE